MRQMDVTGRHWVGFFLALCLGVAAVRAESAADHMAVDFTAYRQTTLINGSLYIYVRNNGPAETAVEDVIVQGKPIRDLMQQGSVAWFRSSPRTIASGAAAEILIRFSRVMPEKLEEMFFADDKSMTVQTRLVLNDGSSLACPCRISDQPPPLQVNYVGFAEDLKKIHLYVQVNPGREGRAGQTFRMKSVSVNGRDCTAQAVFGRRTLGAGPAPVEILLDRPLLKGDYAVITVETEEGSQAGHAVRALPAEFPIVVVFYAAQLRHDAVRDLYNHCVTDVSAGRDVYSLEQAGQYGLNTFIYGGRNTLDLVRKYDDEKYPPIKGVWVDEIDDHPIEAAVELMEQTANYYRSAGSAMPLYTLNLCGSTTPRGANFLELGDAVTHEFGLDGLGRGAGGFAAYNSLPGKEYRLARRAFVPYLRNAEVGIEVALESDEVIGLSPNRAYVLEPREERWMTYGVLMEGAKGVMHWGYGAWKRKAPNWFSKQHAALRIGMGALPDTNMVYGHEIPEHVVRDLAAVWDEIGRINAELRVIGPLVAISDLADWAAITAVKPAGGAGFVKARPAEIATLVCGLDTVMVVLLNMNMDTTWTPRRQYGEGIKSYDPVDVSFALNIPPWLEPRDVFKVAWDGITPLTPAIQGRTLTMRRPRLEVSEIVVVTADAALQGRMAQTLSEMQARLARIPEDTPEPIEERCRGLGFKTKRVRRTSAPDAVYLSDIRPAAARQGWGSLRLDASVSGGRLTILDQVFDKGLGTHAESEIIYDICGQYARLEGWAGIDRLAFPTGCAIFQIFVDGQNKFDSGLISAADSARRYEIDLAGANELKLTVLRGTDGSSKHANWADAKLFKAEAAAPPPAVRPARDLDWSAVSGRWNFAGGKCVFTKSPDDGNIGLAVSSSALADGTLEVQVTPTQTNRVHGIGGYGPVKFIDKANYIAVRFGAYGSITLEILKDGKKRLAYTGMPLKMRQGASYQLKALFNGASVMLLADGEVLGVIDGLPFAGQAGRAGLFAFGACEFDGLILAER